MFARRTLAAIAIALTPTVGVAGENTVSYPEDRIRVYDATPGQLLSAVRDVLEDHGFEFAVRSEADGLLVTGPRRLDKKRLPGLEPFETPPEFLPRDVEIHAFVPPAVWPARLYLGSILESRYRGTRRSRIVYSSGHVERWLQERVAERLGAAGQPLPFAPLARTRFLREHWPELADDPCLDADPSSPIELVEDCSEVTRPSVIAKSKIGPRYPAMAWTEGKGGEIELAVLVDEAGAVGHGRMSSGAPPRSELEVAAFKTVELWRFTPGRAEDGCPTSFWICVVVEFRPR